MRTKNKKINVAYNLIAYHDTKAEGSFVFMRRLFEQMWECDLSSFHFIVYIQKHINIDDFYFPKKCSHEIVRVPKLKNSIFRILFEQIAFYFYLRPSKILFSPSSISMPIFSRSHKIQTIHDMIPFIFLQKYSRFRQWYIKMMTKCVARTCDHIVTVSQNSKNDIMKYLNVKSSKISVIYNFIPYSIKVINTVNIETDMEVKSSDGNIIDINKNFFLTVATLQPAKNIEGLIKAFKKFNQTHQDYYLYIVGNKGWGYKKMYILAEELQLSENVLFTGFVDDYNLSKLYIKCLGIAYFSFYEGFGIPPLEGFYHGKACVASNTSSIPEVVGNAGILADPYDIDDMANAMEQFLYQRPTLEKNIQTQINLFDPKEQTNNFLRLFLD